MTTTKFEGRGRKSQNNICEIKLKTVGVDDLIGYGYTQVMNRMHGKICVGRVEHWMVILVHVSVKEE